jgi:hypothetical protein
MIKTILLLLVLGSSIFLKKELKAIYQCMTEVQYYELHEVRR